MNELVRQLSDGWHPVELVLRPEKTEDVLRACFDRRYVHIKFAATRGGTELGMRIDDKTRQLALEAIDSAASTIHIVGDLVLDYVPVRCVADIELATCEGTGQLCLVRLWQPR
jgi:hypothetical protein